ncbi:MAG: TetR/AcrR family transcriptional regulator [Faecousia sp.]
MAQYTKKAILQTFQEMLEKMPFDKITVSAIVSNCEISSNTFYYHYQDIYDLLDTWLSIKKEKYIEQASLEIRWQDTAKAVLHVLKNHSDIVYHLFNSLSRERIERYIFESTDDTFYRLVCRETAGVAIPEQELRNIAEYNSYSFLGFFLKFLWNQMDDDIDLGIEKIGDIFENNIQWLKEKYMQK